MQIRVTKTAQEDLVNIKEYIDNEKAYLTLMSRINSIIKLIKHNVLIGKEGRIKNTREMLISSTNYFIVYSYNDKCLNILTILHASRKYH